MARATMISLPPLYPITDASSAVPLSEQIRRFGDCGFPLVQFRGKPLEALAQWHELRRALQASHANGGWPLIGVNDRADLAVLAVREGLVPWGLHLGQTDLPPTAARRLPGLTAVHLGTSTHEAQEWNAPDPACDHAGVGPIRGTATKTDHATPIGFAGLRQGAARLRGLGLASVAIGGLGPGDFDACFAAGADSLALVSALATAPAPAELLWQAQAARWRAQPPLRKGQGVVLAGSSGAGKSALGAALAKRLGLPSVDLDPLIETGEGQSISAIFATRGEAAFRALEADYAAEPLAHPCVLALGGGAWEVDGVRRAVRDSASAVLWLAETPQRCWARIVGDPHRPLAGKEATYLSRHRERLGRWADLSMVLPLGRSPFQIAETLASAID